MDNTKTIDKVKTEKPLTWGQLYKKMSKDTDFSAKDLQVMRDNVAKNTSPSEFKYFLNVSKASGLNPFLKEIWCFKDGRGNLLIFASKDGFLKKAQSNPVFDGIRSSEICANDQFTIDIANNKIVHNIADIANRGAILGAYAIVFRKGGEPTIELADVEVYKKIYPGKDTPWKTHTAEMIKKVAEVHALKKAFGMSDLQIEEDFNIQNGVIEEPKQLQSGKKKLTGEEFEHFLTQSDDFIQEHLDLLELTEEQQKIIDKRLQ
jgi:phage recombination protein Bet